MRSEDDGVGVSRSSGSEVGLEIQGESFGEGGSGCGCWRFGGWRWGEINGSDGGTWSKERGSRVELVVVLVVLVSDFVVEARRRPEPRDPPRPPPNVLPNVHRRARRRSPDVSVVHRDDLVDSNASSSRERVPSDLCLVWISSFSTEKNAFSFRDIRTAFHIDDGDVS